jgi:hypothetical protein
MLGKRHHYRLKGSFRITWILEGETILREGIISNMSVDGMELITKPNFKFVDGCQINIEDDGSGGIPLKSSRLKIVWSKKVLLDGIENLKCGLVFVK